MIGSMALRGAGLPRSLDCWKWRALPAFAGLYLFLYLERVNFWPVAALVKQEPGPCQEPLSGPRFQLACRVK